MFLGLGFRVRVRLRLRVSNNIKYTLFFVHVLHFIHLYSVGGATVGRTELAISLIIIKCKKLPFYNNL